MTAFKGTLLKAGMLNVALVASVYQPSIFENRYSFLNGCLAEYHIIHPVIDLRIRSMPRWIFTAIINGRSLIPELRDILLLRGALQKFSGVVLQMAECSCSRAGFVSLSQKPQGPPWQKIHRLFQTGVSKHKHTRFLTPVAKTSNLTSNLTALVAVVCSGESRWADPCGQICARC